MTCMCAISSLTHRSTRSNFRAKGSSSEEQAIALFLTPAEVKHAKLKKVLALVSFQNAV